MADTTIIPISDVKVGIKAETAFGDAIDSSGADGTAYRQLPIVQATKPTFNITRESRLLSGRGLVKHSADSIINKRGGTVTMPFEMIATPKLLAQHLALVGQEHSETGTYVHTTEIGGQGTMLSGIGASPSNNIPQTVNLAYYTRANEGIRVCGAVCSDLTIGLDYGTNGGYMSLSGNYFSGFSNNNALTTTANEVDFTIANWTAPETTGYYNIGDMSTKTLTVDGTAREFILKNLSISIANGVNRVGFDTDGNAEAYALPEYAITGSMTIKYDDNFDYGSSRNVLEDFLDGDTLALTVNIGDGTLSSVGECNIKMKVQYTGDPQQDVSETGIFHTLAFEGVSSGTSDGDEALQVSLFNAESQSAW